MQIVSKEPIFWGKKKNIINLLSLNLPREWLLSAFGIRLFVPDMTNDVCGKQGYGFLQAKVKVR